MRRLSNIPEHLMNKINNVKMIIMDVDGVLTDGMIYYSSDGAKIKAFNVKDGSGIKFAQRSGLKVAIISGQYSRAVENRAKDLEINEVFQMAKEKLPVYQELKTKYKLKDHEIAYIGDDVLDLPIMQNAGFAVAVADSVEEVRLEADYITTAPGGRGAVRETMELILQSQGKWGGVMERYQNLPEDL